MSYMLLIIEPTTQRATRTEAEGREVYARMQRFGETLQAQGKLKASESLALQASAVRVSNTAGRATVVDGPVAEAKALIAGCTLIQVRTREEALAWSRRFPNPAGRGKDAVVELRQLYELDDFPPSQRLEDFKKLDTTLKN